MFHTAPSHAGSSLQRRSCTSKYKQHSFRTEAWRPDPESNPVRNIQHPLSHCEGICCLCMCAWEGCLWEKKSNSAEGCESVGFHMLLMHILYYSHTVCTWLRQNDNRNALYKKKTQNKNTDVCEARFKKWVFFLKFLKHLLSVQNMTSYGWLVGCGQ